MIKCAWCGYVLDEKLFPNWIKQCPKCSMIYEPSEDEYLTTARRDNLHQRESKTSQV